VREIYSGDGKWGSGWVDWKVIGDKIVWFVNLKMFSIEN
jgi:hypothetical protein